MIIKISNLSEGSHEFVFEDKTAKINLSDPFYGSFKSSVVLNKLHDQLIVSVNSIFKAKFECDRCANEYKTKITSDYKIVYLMNEAPEETSSLNVNYLSRDAVKIDLTNDVREFALLSVPMKKLCAEDCKGLCPKCGIDLNNNKCNCTEDEVDPRWKPLIDLKEKLNLN
jgi:uncharacterized protein